MDEDLEQYYIYSTHKNENNEIVNEVEVDLHDSSRVVIFRKSDNDSFCFFQYNMHKNDNDPALINAKEINKNTDQKNQDSSRSLIFIQQSRDVSSFIKIGLENESSSFVKVDLEEEINANKSLLIFLPEKTDSKNSSYIVNEVDVSINKNQENLYNKSDDEIRNNTILKNSIYSNSEYDIADLFAEVDFTKKEIADEKSDFDNSIQSDVSIMDLDLNDIKSEQSELSIIEPDMSSIEFDLSNSYEHNNSSIFLNESYVEEKELSILIELSRLFPEANNNKINHIINNNFTNNNIIDEHKSLNSSYAADKADVTEKICNKDKKDKMEYDLVVSEINEEYCEDFKEQQNLKELNFIQNNVGNNIDNNNIDNNVPFEVSEYVLFEGEIPALENHVKQKPKNMDEYNISEYISEYIYEYKTQEKIDKIETSLLDEKEVIEAPLLDEYAINNYYDNKNINNDVFDVYKEQDKEYKSTNDNDIAFDNLYNKNQKEDYVLNKKAIDIYEQKNVLSNNELSVADAKVRDAKSLEENDGKYSVEEEKHLRNNKYIGFYTRKKLGI